MRILHTADWHLGQRFFELDRFEEHELFLEFLLNTIIDEKIDLLLLAGDVFDTANPPREAERLYYDFLRKLVDLKTCRAVIVGGNHDSATHLNAPARFLEGNGIHVVGALPDRLDEAFFEFDTCCIAAIPYLRDRDVRKAVAGESIDDLEARTKAGILQCYASMAEIAESRAGTRPTIATGHLTAVGGSLSDSERTIHIGNLGSISAGQFPVAFDYVALGHLHVPQAVGERACIRYSGSPIPLSFGEAKTQKQVRIIEIENGQLSHRAVEVPSFRRLLRLKGNPEELRKAVKALEVLDSELVPWLELSVQGGELLGTLNDDLRTLASEQGAMVLKVSVERGTVTMGDLFTQAEAVSISELKPEVVFAKRMESYEGPVKRSELDQCFHALVRSVEEGGEA